ncbi:hypothetical protein E2C01_037093 [Portunus trituberculatus]|uniref:Uncharacterized protein n=1 Tax=Portunus trituberculatus TaxID=210409 RepID=A0A5B7FD74_PORTR|nr:hypothetical protein [Portunus trituberculatus]
MSVLGGRSPLTAEGTASSSQALGKAVASHAQTRALFVWQSITRPFETLYRPKEKRRTMTVYKSLDVSGGSIVWRLVSCPLAPSVPLRSAASQPMVGSPVLWLLRDNEVLQPSAPRK